MLIPRRRRLQHEEIEPGATSSYRLRAWQHPTFRFNWHQHPEVEIGYILRGRGRRYVGDSIEDFAEGDFIIIGADVPHTWHTEPERGRTVRSLCLQFLPRRLGAELWRAPEMAPIARLIARSSRGLKVVGRTRDAAARRLETLHDLPRGGWRDLAGLIELLGPIAESREVEPLCSQGYQGSGARADARVNRLIGLLHRAPDEIPPQATAARAMAMTPTAFSRFVSRTLGRTWVESVNERRIAHACRSLIETDDRITDLAFASGFNNLSNFNRRFRAATGVSPHEYRARVRRAERD